MTVEVAIMNKEAVALAADSATTLGGGWVEKIFTSANKIFVLSKYEPVGIMVYGNATFMGIPWETVIKMYRSKLGHQRFGTLKGYGEHFINYLSKETQLSPESQQKTYIKSNVYGYFMLIRHRILEGLDQALAEKEQISEDEVAQIVSQIVQSHLDTWEQTELEPSIPRDHLQHLAEKYREVIDSTKNDVFQRLPVTPETSKQLSRIAANLFVKFPKELNPPFVSGVVVAGFGSEDIFPALASYLVEGVANGVLKFKQHKYFEINLDNAATIVPFAQSDVVVLFMEGVDPRYQTAIERDLSDILNVYPGLIVDDIEELDDAEKTRLKAKYKELGAENLAKYTEGLKAYRREHCWDPILQIVGALPKSELAEMAEALVNLTCFKRKMSMEAETVGGPIDVALISKGDGLIWIKRKHYFEPELNRQFFANYYREVQDGEEGSSG